MIIRVINRKGGKDRDLPLSPALLETLRAHWRRLKPRTYLFPSRAHRDVEEPITDNSVWVACTEAARLAGIRKRVTPHTLTLLSSNVSLSFDPPLLLVGFKTAVLLEGCCDSGKRD